MKTGRLAKAAESVFGVESGVGALYRRTTKRALGVSCDWFRESVDSERTTGGYGELLHLSCSKDASHGVDAYSNTQYV